jgi:Cu2+-containing amine oxidase
MILHDVTYGGRELFHRLSLSEMFVPYGDPRMPYSRKSVFDVGDIGAGVAANNLALGCDCLGVFKVWFRRDIFLDLFKNTPQVSFSSETYDAPQYWNLC